MRQKLFWCIIFAFTFEAEAILIYLKDGTVVQGEILDHSDAGIQIRRLDNEGVIEILWEELHPLCEQRLKEHVGLIEPAQISYTIKGLKIYLKNGGIVYGELIANRKQCLIVQSNTKAVQIPKSNIYEDKIEYVDLPITSVYSPEQIYQKYSEQYDLKTAEGNLEFARFLLKVGNYGGAEEHLRRTEKLQPALSSEIEILRKSATKQREEEEKQKGLQEIKKHKRYHHYPEALAALEKLRSTLLQADYTAMRSEILAEQIVFLQREVPKKWFQKASAKINRIARNRNKTIEEAQNYVVETMNREIVEELAEEYDIAGSLVEQYFQSRPLGSFKGEYSYGSGTFIVAPSSPKAQKGYIDEELKIKFSTTAAGSSITADEWWQQATSSRRVEWLWAYYCENAMEGCEIVSKDCPDCEGKGKKIRKKKTVFCPSCNGSGHERIVVVN